jgi:hypothetical protein
LKKKYEKMNAPLFGLVSAMYLCSPFKVKPTLKETSMKENKEKITMLHGAGGTVMHDLVKNTLFLYVRQLIH